LLGIHDVFGAHLRQHGPAPPALVHVVAHPLEMTPRLRVSTLLQVAVPEPLADHAVGSGLEPFRRQRHDEYSRGADRSTDYHHPIRCKLLRQRAYNRNQKDDHDCVDVREFSDWGVQPELANPELRKHVIHLQKNGFEKSDQQEKDKYPVETGLTNQPPEELRRVDRAFSHRFSDVTPKCGGRGTRFLNHSAFISWFRAAPDKIEHGKQHDLERQADHEQLLV